MTRGRVRKILKRYRLPIIDGYPVCVRRGAFYFDFGYPFEIKTSRFLSGHGGLTKEEILVNVWMGEK